ncbi:hypothetical protein FB451DRAFT_1515601, partial [Mycena latifolia]
MAPQPSIAQIRFEHILTSLNGAVATLELLSDALKVPFLGSITNTTQSLLTAVQTVKRNKDDCGFLSPQMLNHLGKFTATLHKIHTFVEAQREKSPLKQFFRQGEMSTLLKQCQTGLQQALEGFKVEYVAVLKDALEMQRDAQKAHDEVLELISSLSDSNNSDDAFSIKNIFSTAHNSSNSLSLLPSKPKIFHGRDSDLSAIIQSFFEEIPRIAILGAGGMGKTSLSKAVLHHPDIAARYDRERVFIACDTVSTSIQLAGLIGVHLGLKPGNDLTLRVVQYFSRNPPSLLILDNLETIWEPTESRGEVEKFLALLTDIQHLALIITMRGAERPAHVRWTRPFLQPLKPLTQSAARQTFVEITDNLDDAEAIDMILCLSDNMPLAINLLANLVDCEGISTVLARWETESTSLISQGCDANSNLELSISLSLSSPRILSLPHARDLLSLVSILPDGLSDVELLQSKLPLVNVLSCKSALLSTALAYIDDQKRLKALAPIREYVQRQHYPGNDLIHPLLKYFQGLLEQYRETHGTISSAELGPRITCNFANIQHILSKRLLHGS